jgi:hypothetical protein
MVKKLIFNIYVKRHIVKNKKLLMTTNNFTTNEVMSFIDQHEIYTHCIFHQNKNKMCLNRSIMMNGLCSIHEQHINEFNVIKSTAKSLLCNNIRKLLNDIDFAKGTETRANIANNIFTLLCKNKWFVYSTDKFMCTVFNKLLELEKQNTEFNNSLYMKIIFPNYNLVQLEI